jgi:hypothetical protein
MESRNASSDCLLPVDFRAWRAGCASTRIDDPSLLTIDTSRLPPPDRTLSIPGLGPCTDTPDRTLHLNSSQ